MDLTTRTCSQVSWSGRDLDPGGLTSEMIILALDQAAQAYGTPAPRARGRRVPQAHVPALVASTWSLLSALQALS